MKAKAILLIGAIVLIVIGCVLAAGCTSTTSAPEVADVSNDTPIVPEPTPVEVAWPENSFYDVMEGTWVENYTESDGSISTTKLTLQRNGSGVVDHYTPEIHQMQGKVSWFCHNNSYITFQVSYPNGYTTSWFYKIGADNKTLVASRNTTEEHFKKVSLDTTIPKFTFETTRKVVTEHDPADYVEDGDYYLEDDYGRSFNETLWTGDIKQYLGNYDFLPRISRGALWIFTIRAMSNASHANEPTGEPVLYQTIDETGMLGWTGTCEDLVILGARGLKELGYNVSILVFPKHMDIGIGEEDYVYFNNHIINKYTTPKINIDEKRFGGYYYIDISNKENNLNLGEVAKNPGYDMTLKKIIPL